MTAAFHSLIRTILWRNRFRIITVLFGVGLMSLVIHWQWHAARELTAISLVCSFFFLFGILCNTQVQANSGFSGLPSYCFRLPVGTKLIWLAHFLVGVGVVIGTYGLWYCLVLSQMSQLIWYGDLGLFLVASFSVFSSIVWGLAGLPRLRIILLAVGFFLMLGLSLGPLGFVEDRSAWWTDRRTEFLLGLGMLAIVSPLLSLPLIVRDRSGGYECSTLSFELSRMASLQWLTRFGGLSVRSTLILNECRRAGWILPLGVSCILGIVHTISLWRDLAHGTVQNEFVAALVDGLLVSSLWVGAFVQGLLLSNSGPSVWAENRKMSAHFGVLPVDSNDILAAKIVAAGISLGLSWIILLCGIGTWHWLWNIPSFWVALKAGGFGGFGGFESDSFRGPVALLGFAFILSWRALMAMFPFGASGRKGFMQLGLVSVVAQAALLFPVVIWASQPLEASRVPLLAGLLWCWFVVEALVFVRELAMSKRQAGITTGWIWGNVSVWFAGFIFCLTFRAWLSEFSGCPPSVSLPLCLVLMPLGNTLAAARLLRANRHQS